MRALIPPPDEQIIVLICTVKSKAENYLYVESIIACVAVYTILLSALYADPVRSCRFPTALANIRIKDPCIFRNLHFGLFHIKQILRLAFLQESERLLS